jgi:hypothetical protein
MLRAACPQTPCKDGIHPRSYEHGPLPWFDRNFKRHFSRAKVNPKPWNWEKSHEIGCSYPVGASRADSSPTRLTLSPQVGRELHVHARQREYEAGGNEDTGCVIEPRNTYCCGQQDIPRGVQRGKPTVSKSRKATVPDTLRRVCGTPPGSKSGACVQRGNSGTWESQCVSLCKIRLGSAARMGKDSRRAEAARASEANRVWEHTGHKSRRAPQGIGEGEGDPNDPEMGHWQS